MALVQQSDLTYIGGFTLPKSDAMRDAGGFGAGGVHYDAISDSLFIHTGQKIGQFSIPTPINNQDPAMMTRAATIQAMTDVGLAHAATQMTGTSNGVFLGGILKSGSDLYLSAFSYYDSTPPFNSYSHWKRSATLSLGTPTLSKVWQNNSAGMVGTQMAWIPAEHRAKLGGPAITGGCCIPIISRTSWGPAALVFDPADIGVAPEPIPATPVLLYPDESRSLGSGWLEQDLRWQDATATIRNVDFIDGTDTLLCSGNTGLGTVCYGAGTQNGGPCFDPESGTAAPHAYPYVRRFWAYDVNDLAAARAGTINYWDIAPYAYWDFTLPTPSPRTGLAGSAYDPGRRWWFVLQPFAEASSFAEFIDPIMHVFEVSVAGGGVTPPPPPPPPPDPPPPPGVDYSLIWPKREP